MSRFVKLLDPHCSKDSVNIKFKMSITSSATASRDHDVPSAKVIFRDKLCLVSITRRDDTPMDASSISEEDIVKICITKGHTHPLGVLHYSAMELVVLFCSTDELKCTTCRIIKMMEFWGEAITVRAMAPSEAHITVYLAMLHLNPSNGERATYTSPTNSPKQGNTASSPSGTWRPCQPQAVSAHGGPNMGNCAMQNTHAPSSSPPNEWVYPSGGRQPEEDDQEGHLSRRGKVGSTEATHSICRARVISWRKGSL